MGYEKQNGIRVYDVDLKKWTTIESNASEQADAISDDGRTILGASKVWRDGKLVIVENARAISDGDTRVAIAAGDESNEGVTITVRGIDGGEERVVHCQRRHGSTRVEFSPSGRLLAINGPRAGVWEWQCEPAPCGMLAIRARTFFSTARNEDLVALVIGQMRMLSRHAIRRVPDEITARLNRS